MTEQDLLSLFMPALCTILISAEDKKGSPLSEQEVIEIRDKSAVIMVSHEHAAKMAESRGYSDIDPENCWYDWQMLRRDLGRKPDLDPGARFSKMRSSDEEFKKTVVSAKETLNVFRRMLAERNKGKIFPLVKTLLSEPGYRANMWLVVRSDNKSSFVGEIFELPSEFKEFRVGQTIEITDDEVQDWMINDDGTLYGGYSLRYSRSKMSVADREAFDRHVGVEKYA